MFFILVAFIFLFAALGELARLPIGPGNGILPNDLLVAFTVGLWFFENLLLKRKFPHSPLWAPFGAFVTVAFISLLNGSKVLDDNEILKSSLYLIRFIEYFLLTFVVLDLRLKLSNIIFSSALLIAIFGFIQLKIYPDFTQMAMEEGWDPHQSRLLSTWFDPNFIGGMLAFVICFASTKILKTKNLPLIILEAILLAALFFTYSRSAYLALVIGLGLIGIIKDRRLIIYGLIALVLLIPLSERAQDRVQDFYHSAKSMLTETYELPDASARLRLDSWDNAITIFQDHPFLGVGYNTYSYAQTRYGFMTEDTHHAATGSDSTILTIIATTGIFGAITYLWLIATILWLSYRRHIGFFAGFIGLLVHSIFVNSLLYTPLLIFIYVALGIILTPKSNHA